LVSDNVIAVLLGILANSIYNIGLVFKKKGTCTLPDIEEQSFWQNIKNFAKCKAWVFGYSLTLIQWFPLMYAIKIGSLSLVAPTMAVGFVVLIIFSRIFLKEPISIMEILGITVIMGSIIALYSISHLESGKFTLDDMLTRFSWPKGYGTLITIGIIIAVLLAVTIKRKYPQAGGLMAIASGCSYAFATIFAKGTIGSLQFGSPDFFKDSLGRWEWWIFLIVMLLGYFVAFTSQQMALQKGKSIVVSPTLDIMNLFTQVMAGVIVFAEWYEVWPTLYLWQKVIKIGSIVLIIIGVAMLSFFSAKDELKDTKAVVEEKIEEEEIKSEVRQEDEDTTNLGLEKNIMKIDQEISTTNYEEAKQITINPNK